MNPLVIGQLFEQINELAREHPGAIKAAGHALIAAGKLVHGDKNGAVAEAVIALNSLAN